MHITELGRYPLDRFDTACRWWHGVRPNLSQAAHVASGLGFGYRTHDGRLPGKVWGK